jgi:hypothetical protein
MKFRLLPNRTEKRFPRECFPRNDGQGLTNDVGGLPTWCAGFSVGGFFVVSRTVILGKSVLLAIVVLEKDGGRSMVK